MASACKGNQPCRFALIMVKGRAMQLEHDGFVVVVDGEKMLLFRNRGDAQYPHLEVIEQDEQEGRSNRELRRDSPGRSFASVGPGRSAYDETDSRQVREDRFAAETAETLNRMALDDRFRLLIIVAPPRTLGELRRSYHDELVKRLIGEVPKNLTNATLQEIERIVLES
jgi:protein required for attachment to host cells